MDMKNIMAALAETYWDRPANEAELVAMIGEAMRDKARVVPSFDGKSGSLFDIEPAHFDAMLLAEANR